MIATYVVGPHLVHSSSNINSSLIFFFHGEEVFLPKGVLFEWLSFGCFRLRVEGTGW